MNPVPVLPASPNRPFETENKKKVLLLSMFFAAIIPPLVVLVRVFLLMGAFTLPGVFLKPYDLVTSTPVVENVIFQSGSGRPVQGKLYLPGNGGTHPATIVYVPMATFGSLDPTLVSIGTLLARSGIATLIPFAEKEPRFVVDREDEMDVLASISYLQQRTEINPSKIGMIGVSYGNSPVLRAAADPELAGKIRYVVSFGGYYDLKNMLKYATTDEFDYNGEKVVQKPHPYVRQIIIDTARQWFKDRESVHWLSSFRSMFIDRTPANDILESPPSLEAVARVLINTKPEAFEGLYEQMPTDVRQRFASLSPYPVVDDIKCRVMIIHSMDDPYIPYTESLRLYDALKGKHPVTLAIVDIFHHAVPKPVTAENLWSDYLPSFFRLVQVGYHMLDI